MGGGICLRAVSACLGVHTFPPPVDRQTPVKHNLSATTVADGNIKPFTCDK